MTRTVTYLASPNTRPATGVPSVTTAPLAVSANSLLVLSCWGINVGNETFLGWNIISNTEGLTFTLRAQSADVGGYGRAAVFTAPVTDAAADLEIEFSMSTAGYNGYYGCQVLEVTDDDDGTVTFVQAAANGVAVTEPFTAGTLGAAATTGNTTLLFVCRNATETEAMSIPTNFAVVHADNAIYADQTSFRSTTFTGTTATVTNVGDGLSSVVHSTMLELASTGGGPGPSTAKYTELEWNLKLQAPAAGSDIYQFRVYAGTTPLATYLVTPQLTVILTTFDLTVNSASQLQAAQQAQPNIVLTVANSAHAQTAAATYVALSLVVANAAQLQTAAGITAEVNLVPATATQTQTAGAVVLIPSLVTADAVQLQTAERPLLLAALAVANTAQGQTAGFVTFGANIVVDDATHVHTAAETFLTPVLAVDSAAQLQTPDSVVIDRVFSLVVASATQIHRVETAPVSANLVAASATQAQAVPNVTVTRVFTLVVQSATHQQIAPLIDFIVLNNAGAVYLGAVALGAVYLGSVRVW